MDLKRAIIDLMPGPLVRTFAAPYISGKGIASGVAKADELHAKQGIFSTVDLLAEGNVHDYDILPQLPIIQGAGGIVTDWEGRPLTDAALFDTLLMAANPQLHAKALAALRPD